MPWETRYDANQITPTGQCALVLDSSPCSPDKPSYLQVTILTPVSPPHNNPNSQHLKAAIIAGSYTIKHAHPLLNPRSGINIPNLTCKGYEIKHTQVNGGHVPPVPTSNDVAGSYTIKHAHPLLNPRSGLNVPNMTCKGYDNKTYSGKRWSRASRPYIE